MARRKVGEMMEFPQYMQMGSKGPHVVLLQVFLKGWEPSEDLVPDGDFGGMTSECLRRYQRSSDLEMDGHFGPATRAKMMQDEKFDFELACQYIPGTTSFVQPDGEIIDWSSEATF